MLGDLVNFRIQNRTYKTRFFSHGSKSVCLRDCDNPEVVYYVCVNTFSDFCQKECLVGINTKRYPNIPKVELFGVIQKEDLDMNMLEYVGLDFDVITNRVQHISEDGLRIYKTKYIHYVDENIVLSKLPSKSIDQLIALLDTSIDVNNFYKYINTFRDKYRRSYTRLYYSIKSIYNSHAKLYEQYKDSLTGYFKHILKPGNLMYDGPKAYAYDNITREYVSESLKKYKLGYILNIGFSETGKLFLMDLIA